MARSALEEKLREHGCEVPIVQFQDLLQVTFPEHFPNWTIDEMLLHPSEAISFCDDIRGRQKDFSTLPDELILRSLLGRRKHPV